MSTAPSISTLCLSLDSSRSMTGSGFLAPRTVSGPREKLWIVANSLRPALSRLASNAAALPKRRIFPLRLMPAG